MIASPVSVAITGKTLEMASIRVPTPDRLFILVMARYDSDKIRGRSDLKEMKKILASRGRIQAKVVVLKPLSSAKSIGAGGPFGAGDKSL